MCVALLGGRAWWVAPSYKMGRVGWRAICAIATQIPGCTVRIGDQLVTFPGGGTVAIRSADDPDSLRGEGLNLAVLDECAFMKEAAWSHALRPALSDRLGGAIFISTPKGRNWFWRLFQRGTAEAEQIQWASWQIPTSDNPYIRQSEIEDAKGEMADLVYEQEYMARFLDDTMGLFKNIMDLATLDELDLDEPLPREAEYVFGVDWGKLNDFSVVAVGEVHSQNIVHIMRMNKITYPEQLRRIRWLAGVFRPQGILVESNAMGEANMDWLAEEGLPVDGLAMTASSKPRLMNQLQFACDNMQIGFVRDPVLIAELQAFEMTQTAGGTIRYEAPPGMHDDCVIATALAQEAMRIEEPVEVASGSIKWY